MGSGAKKDLNGSLSHFAKAAQAFPAFYEAYYQAGVVKTTLGRLGDAMEAFQKAIDLSGGKYAWAEIGCGYILYLEGKTEEAVRGLSRGLGLEGDSADGYFILGMGPRR